MNHEDSESPTYKRLIEAAKAIRQWASPTEISKQSALTGYSISMQMLSNWKKRGVSQKGILLASLAIGCSAEWILTGAGQMEAPAQSPAPGNTNSTPDPNKSEEPPGTYNVQIERMAKDEEELKLLRGWRKADQRDRHHIMLTIDDILKTGRAAA